MRQDRDERDPAARAEAWEVPDEAGAAGMREVEALLVTEQGAARRTEVVAVEMRADILLDGEYWASAALTPSDLEDYALGALFGAGAIARAADVASVDVRAAEGAAVLDVQLAPGVAHAAPRRCCGLAAPAGAVFPGCTLAGALREGGAPGAAARKRRGLPLVEPEAIWRMSRALLPVQGMHRATGATHAAVFAGLDGRALLMREDVGRHNAVDKLVGALLRAGIDPAEGFAYLSSRCALELVAKLARAGVRLVATVSAPTTAVLDFAEREDVTLCAFAREGRFTVYAHPERIAR
ncbi:formate dehydrogenase accessory sulfurtransferase FdhD [Arabiibacter massiliensis]|uniref:formate dehydrogenase accessory sulfurtransferase FdhD n=1 Tax=Arabiibacter massiliensis TaxID=1870985 RepID=UPI00155A077A|nr:formate dehydrogenase accessory sulfurtransferase FdhD [Arabiibacter massiliensis]